MVGYPKLNRSRVNLVLLLASLLVVLFHSYALGDYADDPVSLFTNDGCTMANVALFIFMFMSGFLVCDSYPDNHAGILSWLEFWVKRVTRLWPGIASVTLLAVFALGPAVTIMNVKDYWRESSTWSYLGNLKLFSLQAALPGVFDSNLHPKVVNGSLWMIAWQMWFYVLISVFGLLRMNKNKVGVSVLFAVVVLVCFAVPDLIRGSVWLGLYPEQGFPLLFFFVTGWMFNVLQDRIVFDRRVAWGGAVVLPFALRWPCADIALACLGGYVLLTFLSRGSAHTCISRLPPLSYGIFIFAFPIQQLLVFWCGGRMYHWTNFIVSLAIAIPLAWAELATVERFGGWMRGRLLGALAWRMDGKGPSRSASNND